MAAEPIIKPELPHVGEIPSGLQPGKMIRIQGITHPNSDRFNINFACGPSAKPRDDTALHISVRLNQGYIARNTYKDGSWGDEQGSGKLPIGQAQSFEIIVLVDVKHYKIAVNGQHFCEFPHRIPFEQVSNLLLDGDVTITLISFEGIPISGSEISSQSSQVNAEGPQGGPPLGGTQYGPPPGAYGAPPSGAYGPPPPNFGYGPPPQGAQPQSETGGFFDQAQDILAGAIKKVATEKILDSILNTGGGQAPQQPQGYQHQNAQYGQYPHPPSQQGPMESLLSGLLSGQQQQPQQQPSGLGSSMGGLLGSLAGTLLHRPGQNQGH